MSRLSAITALASLVALISCGGASDTTTGTIPVSTGGVVVNTVSAVIDGVPFTSTDTSVSAGYGTLSHRFGLAGFSTSESSSPRTEVAIAILNAPAANAVGRYTPVLATVYLGDATWTLADTSGATMTITTWSATHAAGTFSFAAVASAGAASGTRHVTNGKFDLAYIDLAQ